MPCWRPLPSTLRCVLRTTGWKTQHARVARSLWSSHRSRCLAAEVVGGSTFNLRRLGLSASIAMAGLGSGVLLSSPLLCESAEEGPEFLPITDQIFNEQDDMFVFFFDQAEEAMNRAEELARVIQLLAREEGLHRVRFFHNIRKEGEDAPPDAINAGSADGASKPLKVVMYKGQRKTVIHIGSEVPVKEILEFYVPVSVQIPEHANKDLTIQQVSGNTFQAEVINASSPERWILVQMFEDTCFLCFLMRPFINSLALLLSEQGVPMTIKRLNIELNDFPDGCPVARGTPTFVAFRGSQVPASKWDEFKPQDLVGKLKKELPKLDEVVYTKMEQYQELVSQRFQFFTQLVVWTVELGKLQALMAASGGEKDLGDKKEKDDAAFSAVVSQMMSQDMKRTDDILSNLKHLQKEIEDTEHDCTLLGIELGKSIIDLEQQAVA